MNKKDKLKATITALIIDDENDICFLLSNILRKNDLKVNYVHSLAEGIASLKLIEPNVLFLDNYLPDGYGMDFLTYVKREHAATKIVMVTAHDTPEDRKNALQSGANIFIAKPFTPDQIKNALQNLYAQ
jgi:DNA-binding response OmpR family regulator